MRRVDVFHYDSWFDETGEPPQKASDFQVWINSIFESIPREFFDSATVEISSTSVEEPGYFQVRISYYRPKTTEDIAEEKAKEQVRLNRAQRERLDTFLRLKEEFEGKGDSK
jgi:hypothetical protein